MAAPGGPGPGAGLQRLVQEDQVLGRAYSGWSRRSSQVRPSSPSFTLAYSARFSAIWQSFRAEYVDPS